MENFENDIGNPLILICDCIEGNNIVNEGVYYYSIIQCQ